MKKITINTYSKDEVFEFSDLEVKNYISQAQEFKTLQDTMVLGLIEKMLAPLLVDYAIDSIGLDPTNSNNEYGPITVFIDEESSVEMHGKKLFPYGENKHKLLTFSLLQERINVILSPVSFLITEDIAIDVNELRTKYLHQQLDNKLSDKKNSTNSLKI